jgi:hypothetical protein
LAGYAKGDLSMNNKWIFPVFLIVSGLLTGCDPQSGHTPTASTAASTTPQPNIKDGMAQYSDDTIQLAYPSTWKTLDQLFNRPPSKRTNKEFGADILLTVTNAIPDSYGSKYTAWCDLMQKTLVPGETREDMVSSSYSFLKNYTQVDASQQDLKIQGVDALEKIYRRPKGEPWYKVRDVWFFLPDIAIVLSCYSHPEDYQGDLEIFTRMQESLRFK